jgi:hypothetical protein
MVKKLKKYFWRLKALMASKKKYILLSNGNVIDPDGHVVLSPDEDEEIDPDRHVVFGHEYFEDKEEEE